MVKCKNEMKGEVIELQRGNYVYEPADAILDYAYKYNMKIRGHTLVWHTQAPWAP